MTNKFIPGVVLKETYETVRRKWIFRFTLVNLIYIIIIAGLLTVIVEEKKTIPSFSDTMQTIEEYRIKDKLYGILRTKGYSLGQGLDIAEAIVKKSKELELPLSLIMAVIHQESEFYPNARSSKGAQGLMQIMPGTATHTVKMFSIPGYSSPGQLLDPETNINIGTSYLQYVYQQFGNNRIFSSAAYNAGPGRVRTWLGNSAGRIDAVAFVESIPFSETRGYVKNVLAYDAYYRYFMGDKPTLMSATEWGRRY